MSLSSNFWRRNNIKMKVFLVLAALICCLEFVRATDDTGTVSDKKVESDPSPKAIPAEASKENEADELEDNETEAEKPEDEEHKADEKEADVPEEEDSEVSESDSGVKDTEENKVKDPAYYRRYRSYVRRRRYGYGDPAYYRRRRSYVRRRRYGYGDPAYYRRRRSYVRRRRYGYGDAQ